ncbi:MAG: tRNA 2-thiouridine(34) synthase MnmA [Ruminococcaceae bacterium]|nr:tRNA 2-thiouridine(34) synthase MnmA [Oscillospiraceae bacterium]
MPHLIAMSGGVDSSAALYLAKQNLGEDLCGLTLALADENSPEHENDIKNIADAASVAENQGIRHTSLYAYPEFSRRVIDYFTREYLSGRTPNPCVICNREIKFGLLSDYAKEHGFDKIVTGHYARLVESDGYTFIKKAVDASKDQSYVLAMLSQDQLRRAHFPLGEYTKAEVREIAEKCGFVNAHRRDSQDICFIPDGDYVKFISQSRGISPEAGDYVDEDGKILGQHKGHWCYTIGQRKGLGISVGRHIFVLSKDAEKNRVILGDEDRLMKKTVEIDGVNLPSDPTALDGDVKCRAKLRYAHREADAVFHRTGEDSGVIEFSEPQRAPSPGQFAVIYSDDIVIGAGVIK